MWSSRIGQGPRLTLFHGYWTYVQSVTLTNTKATIRFNPATRTPGPFDLHVSILEHQTGIVYTWRHDHYEADGDLTLSMSNLVAPERYRLSCYLNNHPAVIVGHTGEVEAPF